MVETIKNYAIGERPTIKEIAQAYKELRPLFSMSKEYFIVLHLDTTCKLISREIVHIGGLNHIIVEPRAIFKNAILFNANNIIIAHNHPSGSLIPSEEDIEVTKKLTKAGRILGIEVIDSIIFNHREAKSLRQS